MPDIATDVMIDCLDEFTAGERPIVIGEDTGRLTKALQDRGVAATEWLRNANDRTRATPWPATGPFTSAMLRLPKSKDALDFALHAIASVVPGGAGIVVFGANAEGIRSAWKHLEAVAEDTRTLATRRHCRVIAGTRRAAIENLRGVLQAWRSDGEISLAGETLPWVSYPGVFAKGAIDEGTALLLAHLPNMPAGARVLDFAAGTGIIAAAVNRKSPSIRVDLVEIDALALAAARENIPASAATRFIAGRSLAACEPSAYGLILSNPPIHDGVAESHHVLEDLIRHAPTHLVHGGELRIVVQRRIDAAALMQSAFGNVDRIAETTRFRILSARKR